MSIHSDHSARQARGEGIAMAQVIFRDPSGLEEQAAALRLEMARILVNATVLPIDLPVFDLTLLDVVADASCIDLVIGKSAPLASLRITRATARPAAEVSGAAAKRSVVGVEIVVAHADSTRFRDQLGRMRERVEAAISAEKWERARTAAKQLMALPVGVPLAFYRQLVPGTPGQALVRTGFNCNQDCGMCWQDRTWGRFDAQQVLTWIEDLRAAGAYRLTISGGEPTLDTHLEEYIRHARQLGFSAITLETNAIQFRKPRLAERLRDAGLGDCFVSLHSGDAATSDAITRAPGTFARTVAGIKALLEARVPVRLNCVMSREGIEHLGEIPDFVHREFGTHPFLRSVMLSQPTDPYDRALLRSIIPEPQRLRAVLPRVIDRAFALGVPISGLDGPCGPPLCAFAADRRITDLRPITEQLQGRTYVQACTQCVVRDACFGVRVADVELYGETCAQTIAAVPAAG